MRCTPLDLREDLIEGTVLFTYIKGECATASMGEGAETLVMDLGKFRIAHGFTHGSQHDKSGQFLGKNKSAALNASEIHHFWMDTI
jgi:hypothetical protein